MLENKPELKITGVEISEYRSGIPLQGWESVKNALYTFASGRSRGGRATQNELLDNMPGGTMGVGLYLLATANIDRNSFVDKMLQDAEVAMKGARWSRNFDYDAMGTSFFKSSVEITRLPGTEDGYLLGLNAAYVGKEVEDGLAGTLGVEQGLRWKAVTVNLEPEGTNFRINFDAVAEILRPLHVQLKPTPEDTREFHQELTRGVDTFIFGERIILNMLDTGRSGNDSNPYFLGMDNGVEVALSLGRVGDRFNWRNGNRDEELWKAEGAILSGPLAVSYSEDRHLETPSLNFNIRRYSEDRYGRLPAIDPQMKATMNDLAVKVATAFR